MCLGGIFLLPKHTDRLYTTYTYYYRAPAAEKCPLSTPDEESAARGKGKRWEEEGEREGRREEQKGGRREGEGKVKGR